MGGPGKRAAARPQRTLTPRAVSLAAGSIASVVVWIVLIGLAIHFGSRARHGHTGDWWLTAGATAAAIAALFVGLLLITRALQPPPPTAAAARSSTQEPPAEGATRP